MPRPTLIGKYEVQSEIGRGGFGQVFRAFDRSVGRSVALKVLLDNKDKDLLSRFRFEATAAGNLRHKNIVTLYEFGEHRGSPFLAMELIEGETLQQIIRARTAVPLFQKVDVMTQVAEGLRCAHQHGLLHRDVKPANIMLTQDGSAKIMDFGIARALQASAERLTQTGFLIGTVHYMAPELFQTGNADALCDLFAFGTIFYEWLAFHHPFEGPDATSTMYRITSVDPPPLTELCEDCPDGLASIVERCIAKRRESRYQSFDDFLFDIEPIRLELKRAQSDLVVLEAKEVLRSGELERANLLIRRSLELDPANTDARLLRAGIQQQIQKRAVSSQVAALLEDADKCLSHRQFPDGISRLENALNLDTSATEISRRLDRAKVAFEHHKKAEALIKEVKRKLNDNDLTGAFQKISAVMQADSSHPEAQSLLDAIQSELKRKEVARQFDQRLVRAKGMLAAEQFEESRAVLDSLSADFPDSHEVRDLQERVQREKDRHARRSELAFGVAHARACIAERRFEEAIAALKRLRIRFPDDPLLTELIAHAELEQKVAIDHQNAERLKGEIDAALQKDDFETSLKLIHRGLATFSGDVEFSKRLRSTLELQRVYDSRKAVEVCLRTASELSGRGDHSRALQLVESAIAEHGDDPQLRELHRVIGQHDQEKRREAAIEKAVNEAEKLSKAGRPKEAVAVLRKALQANPENSRLSEALATVHVVTESAREEALTRIKRSVSDLAGVEDFEAAFDALQKGLQQFPAHPDLRNLEAEIVRGKASRHLEQKIGDLLRDCAAFIRAERHRQALDLLSSLEPEISRDYRIKALLERLQARCEADESKHRSQEIADHLNNATRLENGGSFELAVRLLENARTTYPSEERIARAVERLQRRIREKQEKAIAEVLSRSVQLESEDKLKMALEEVYAALKAYPGTDELTEAARRLEEAIAAQARSRRVKDRVVQAETLIGRGRLNDAAELILAAQREFGTDPLFTSVLLRLRQLNADKEAEDFRLIQEVLTTASEHEQNGDLYKAAAAIESGLQSSPTAFELRRAAARLELRIKDAGERQKIASAIDGIEKALAEEDVEQAAANLLLAKQEFGEHAAFTRLGEELERARRRLNLRKLLNEVESLCAAGDWNRAAGIIQDARKVSGSDQNLAEIEKTFQSRKAVFDALCSAREELGKRSVRKAEDFVARALKHDPTNEEAIAVLRSIRTLKEVQSPQRTKSSWLRYAVTAGCVILLSTIGFSLRDRNAPGVSLRVSAVEFKDASGKAVNKESESKVSPSQSAGTAMSPSRGEKPLVPPKPNPPLHPPASVQTHNQPLQPLPAKPIILQHQPDPTPKPIPTSNQPLPQASAPPIAPAAESEPSVQPAEPLNPEDYTGEESGKVTWKPPGDLLDLNQIIKINRKTAKPGSILLKGFPGVPIDVSILQGNVVIVEAPTEKNPYGLSFRFKDGHPSTVVFGWHVKIKN